MFINRLLKYGKTQSKYLLRVSSVAVCPGPRDSGDVYGRGECSEYLNEAPPARDSKPPAVPCYKWSLYSATTWSGNTALYSHIIPGVTCLRSLEGVFRYNYTDSQNKELGPTPV